MHEHVGENPPVLIMSVSHELGIERHPRKQIRSVRDVVDEKNGDVEDQQDANGLG